MSAKATCLLPSCHIVKPNDAVIGRRSEHPCIRGKGDGAGAVLVERNLSDFLAAGDVPHAEQGSVVAGCNYRFPVWRHGEKTDLVFLEFEAAYLFTSCCVP